MSGQGKKTYGTRGSTILKTDNEQCALKKYTAANLLKEFDAGNISIPVYQRKLIKTKSKSIFQDIRSNYLRNKHYLLMGDPIKVGRYNDKNFLIDGQHRIEAIKMLKKLAEKYPDNFSKIENIPCTCLFIVFQDRADAEDYYNTINVDRDNKLEIKPEFMDSMFKEDFLSCSDSED